MKVPGYSACNPNKILIGRYCIIEHNIFKIKSLSQFCHIYWPSILKYYIFVCKENFPFFLYVQFQVTAGTWYYLSLPVPVQIGAVSICTGTKIGRPGLYDGCIYANTSILSVQLILLIDEHRGTDWVIDRCYCGVSKIAIFPLSFVTFGTGDKYPSQMLRQKVTTFLILVVCSWYLASMVYRENGRIYANTSILSVQLILLIDEHRGTVWVIDRCYYGVPFYRYNWYCLSTNTVELIGLSTDVTMVYREKMEVLMPITEAAHVDAISCLEKRDCYCESVHKGTTFRFFERVPELYFGWVPIFVPHFRSLVSVSVAEARSKCAARRGHPGRSAGFGRRWQ